MPAAKKTVEGLLSKVAGKKKVTLTVQNSNGVGTQYTLSEVSCAAIPFHLR